MNVVRRVRSFPFRTMRGVTREAQRFLQLSGAGIVLLWYNYIEWNFGAPPFHGNSPRPVATAGLDHETLLNANRQSMSALIPDELL